MSPRIINLFWRDYEPYLMLVDGKREFSLPLMNLDISLRLGNRYCIGYFKDETRVPCPSQAKVKESYQCKLCMSLDEHMKCASCTGEKCLLKKRREVCKREEYSVYLAIFGDILKVGISREPRLRLRLIEQGCDFAARIVKVRDGKMARSLEQYIREKLGIVDRVKTEEKANQAVANPQAAIGRIFDSLEILREDRRVSPYLTFPEIFDLRSFYNIPPQPMELIRVRKGMKLEGRVIGVKGSLIFIRNKSRDFSLNGKELIGFEIFNVA